MLVLISSDIASSAIPTVPHDCSTHNTGKANSRTMRTYPIPTPSHRKSLIRQPSSVSHISRKPCQSASHSFILHSPSRSRPTDILFDSHSSVSALVVLLTSKEDGEHITFEAAITTQIRTLRKQLDKSPNTDLMNLYSLPSVPSAPPAPLAGSNYADANSYPDSASSLVDSLTTRFDSLHTTAGASGIPPTSANGFTSVTPPGMPERDIISVLHNFVQRIGGNGALQGVNGAGVPDDRGYHMNVTGSAAEGAEDGFSMRRWM